jgi:hypothetical protein
MTGEYLVDRKTQTASPAAYDESVRKNLWEVSEELTSLEASA